MVACDPERCPTDHAHAAFATDAGTGSPRKPSPGGDSLQGSIVIGVPTGTSRQISSISASVTAMQPSVQSRP